ncbi:MAG: type II toxin-antitoxin system ParD family antitoxin [Gemmataceae bacterium]|nr:type II toxin-antitoxin system ParD family antitoxin [Gemmataceae bacterium]
MNITLPPDLAAIVKKQISSGRYRSKHGVIGDALRLLQAQNRTDAEKLEDLRREIALGLEEAERGELLEFNDELIEEIKRSGRERLKRKAKERDAKKRKAKSV